MTTNNVIQFEQFLPQPETDRGRIVNVLRHVQDSNMPDGVKEYLTRQIMGGFPDAFEDKSVPVIKEEKKEVVETKRTSLAEAYVLARVERIGTRNLNAVLRVMHKHLERINGVEFRKLTRDDVLNTSGCGEVTWEYVREIQATLV